MAKKQQDYGTKEKEEVYKCKCGEKMIPFNIPSTKGEWQVIDFYCPKARLWNFWRHTPSFTILGRIWKE